MNSPMCRASMSIVIKDGKPLDRIDPKQAEQHGVYYQATKEGEPGVIVMDPLPDFLANHTATPDEPKGH